MESLSDSPAVQKVAALANGQVTSFLDNVEDLVTALKNVESPDTEKLRAKVKLALAAAKSAVSDTAAQIRSQAEQVGKRTDGYIRDNPWQVVGIAALIGLAVGIFAGRRSS
jgi:ElaB/YqjD/DUF883 family membrane-anchored ribosome-binding protein